MRFGTLFIAGGLTLAMLCVAAPSAEASYHVSCVMKAKILKVHKKKRRWQVKARFWVYYVGKHQGHSGTFCNKFRKKALTRPLDLRNEKRKLRAGQRVRIRFRYNAPRRGGPHESWLVL